MTCHSVAAMLEETASVPSRESIERSAHRFYQSLAGACLECVPRTSSALPSLWQGLLYRVEIGRVGRQVGRLASPLLDQLLTLPPLCTERSSITTTCPGPSEGTKKRSR
jgi:hypothetical protein